MSRRKDYYRGPGSQWDREHFERSMDDVRRVQGDSDKEYTSVGGAPYGGGVFSPATYGSGAEFYSVTGMYENPLMHNPRTSHSGKGPKNYKRSDERIHEEVCERLTRHPAIDASTMDVQVEKGDITLSGEVFNRHMKFMAEDVASEVPGVKEIHNRLRVLRDSAA